MPPEQNTKRLPWLDSLRFGAFFVVFIVHVTGFLVYPKSLDVAGSFSRAILQNGDLGVSLFFVLSGFLITYLLEREYEKYGKISLKNFYIRRVLRIWPLYFFTLVAILGVSFFAAHSHAIYKVGIVPIEFISHTLFSGNIYRAFWNTANEMVSVLWSVGVEEQFYLIWPILFMVFRKREKLNWVITLGILISMVARWFYHDNFDARQFFTLSVMSDLFIGAWIGLHAERVKAFVQGRWIRLIAWSGVVVVFLLALIRGLIFYQSIPPWFASGMPMVTASFFGLLIAYLAFASGGPKAPITKVWERCTAWFGERSYGLYVLHMLGITLAVAFTGIEQRESFIPFIRSAILAFGITVGISALSFRFLEKPFLALKERLTLQ